MAYLAVLVWAACLSWLLRRPGLRHAGRSWSAARPGDAQAARRTGTSDVAPAPGPPGGASLDLLRQHFGPGLDAVAPGQVSPEGELVVVTRPVHLQQVADAIDVRAGRPVLVVRHG